MPLWLYSSTLLAAASIPEKCFQESLKTSFPKVSVGQKSDLFVKCSNDRSEPLRGQKRPAYKPSEIKQIHQAFLNMSDCFEIDPRWLFPKLMMESGFHPSIQNPNGDAGIGQLTWTAIRDVDSALPEWKRWLAESKKPSCRWVYAQTKAKKNFWQPVQKQTKCALMGTSSGIFKNLFYTTLFHRLNKEYVEKEFNNKKIRDLLVSTGFPVGFEQKLKSILLALGYNTGGATAVKNLQEYLLQIQEDNLRITSKLKGVEKLLGKPLIQKRSIALKDFDFTIRSGRESKVLASEMSFPLWLKRWQSHGGKGYLSNLAEYAKKMDRSVGPGICGDTAKFRISSLDKSEF